MKRTNPTAKKYEYGINAPKMNQGATQPDMAGILKQCANAMMEKQRQKQERQQQFKNVMAANMVALQSQLNKVAA